MAELEQEIKELIKKYGAPENIEQALIDFLIETGHLYSIAEILKRYPT